MTIWHRILNAGSTKTPSSSVMFVVQLVTLLNIIGPVQKQPMKLFCKIIYSAATRKLKLCMDAMRMNKFKELSRGLNKFKELSRDLNKFKELSRGFYGYFNAISQNLTEHIKIL